MVIQKFKCIPVDPALGFVLLHMCYVVAVFTQGEFLGQKTLKYIAWASLIDALISFRKQHGCVGQGSEQLFCHGSNDDTDRLGRLDRYPQLYWTKTSVTLTKKCNGGGIFLKKIRRQKIGTSQKKTKKNVWSRRQSLGHSGRARQALRHQGGAALLGVCVRPISGVPSLLQRIQQARRPSSSPPRKSFVELTTPHRRAPGRCSCVIVLWLYHRERSFTAVHITVTAEESAVGP